MPDIFGLKSKIHIFCLKFKYNTNYKVGDQNSAYVPALSKFQIKSSKLWKKIVPVGCPSFAGKQQKLSVQFITGTTNSI